MDTVKVSRKFQVVIPEKVREPLHLKLDAVLQVSVYGRDHPAQPVSFTQAPSRNRHGHELEARLP
jgi:AbrB family looped-hinge helix DNA binding protein